MTETQQFEFSQENITRLKQKDPESWEIAHQFFWRMIYGYLSRRLDASSQEKEDLTSQVIFQLYASLDIFEYRGTNSFLGWIYFVAGNVLKNYYRSRRVRQEVELSEEVLAITGIETASPENIVLDEIELKKALRRLRLFIRDLEPRQQQIFWMRHEEHLKFREIAGRLGTTEEAAKAAYFRIVVRLRQIRSEILSVG